MFAVLYLLSTLMLSVNADFPTCWEFEVAYGSPECMDGTTCWNNDKTPGTFIDAYQIEISGGYMYHLPHNSINGQQPICRQELATGNVECPYVQATGGGTMIGLTVDPVSGDIYYGAGNCVKHWDKANDVHVHLGCKCRIWGMALHHNTKDIYFGCRESREGFYRLEYDESESDNYKDIALIVPDVYAVYNTIDQDNDVLYFTDGQNHQVKSMVLDGSFTTTVIAGTGSFGFSGDGGLATDAQLNYPTGIARNAVTGDIFVYDQSDQNTKRLRMIQASTGIIKTIVSGNKANGPPSRTTVDGGWWDASGELPLVTGDIQFATCCGSGSLAIDQTTQELYFGNTYDSTVLKILPGSVESSDGQCVRLPPATAGGADADAGPAPVCASPQNVYTDKAAMEAAGWTFTGLNMENFEGGDLGNCVGSDGWGFKGGAAWSAVGTLELTLQGSGSGSVELANCANSGTAVVMLNGVQIGGLTKAEQDALDDTSSSGLVVEFEYVEGDVLSFQDQGDNSLVGIKNLKTSDGCLVVADYTRTEKGCVNGENIKKLKNKSAQQCAELCTEYGTKCVGFELYRNYGGGKGMYGPGDCNLQSATDMSGCDGTKYNLDFYTRNDFKGSPDLLAALEALRLWSEQVALSTEVSCTDYAWLEGCDDSVEWTTIWENVYKTCSQDHIIESIDEQTLEQCKVLCEAEPRCLRFFSNGNCLMYDACDSTRTTMYEGTTLEITRVQSSATDAVPTNDDMVKFTAMVASNFHTLDGFQPDLNVEE